MRVAGLVMTIAAHGVAGCTLNFDVAKARGCDQTCTNCCEADMIVGGTFDRGWDRSNDGIQEGVAVRGFIEQGRAPATLSTFVLDRYEVTRSRFARFVESYDAWRALGHPQVGAGSPPGSTEVAWLQRWTDDELEPTSAELVENLGACGVQSVWLTGAPRHPINCVSWYVAYAFCIWDGGRLGTEAEWNYAAAGGDEQRAFPWSDPPSSLVADDTYFVGLGGDGPKGVGSAELDVARWGTHDLAGNLREWVLDSHDGDWSKYETPCNDCAVFIGGTGRIRRGSDFESDEAHARTAWRSSFDRDARNLYTGIRCVRPVD